MDNVSSCLLQQTLGASNWPYFFPASGTAVQIQTAAVAVAATAAAAVSAQKAVLPEEPSNAGEAKGSSADPISPLATGD